MKKISLTVTKTLYHNTYRCVIHNENDAVIGFLRVIPGIPLDRSAVPEDAPVAPTFLLVIVDDADITEDNLLVFEENVSISLLGRFTTENAQPQYCQFYYPSPAFNFTEKDTANPFVC